MYAVALALALALALVELLCTLLALTRPCAYLKIQAIQCILYNNNYYCLGGNTRFLVTTSFNESSRSVTATFQSDKFRGRYLIMTQRHRPKDQPVSTSGRRRLRLGYPQDNNQIFEVIHTDNPLYIGLRDSEGCYVGFEGNGNQLQQCTLIQDHRTKLILKIFEGELD